MRAVGATLVVLLLALMTGCASTPPGDKPNEYPSGTKEEAIALVKAVTPIKTVQSVDRTPPGPRMWVVYGADESGRTMAAWVWKPGKVEGYTFTDKGISGADAVAKAKAAGFTPLDFRPMLIRPGKPAWYVVVQGNNDPNPQGVVLVDLDTGEVEK